MKSLLTRRSLAARLLRLLLVVIVVVASFALITTASAAPGNPGVGNSKLSLGPVAKPVYPSGPLTKLAPTKKTQPSQAPAVAAQALPAGASASSPRDMRILVISRGSGAWGDDTYRMQAITQFLQQIGIPYDSAVIATDKDATGSIFTKYPLWDDAKNKGKYQGIILNNNLVVDDLDSDGLSSGDFAALKQYESALGVRQVTYYSVPEGSIGLDWGTTRGCTTTPYPYQFGGQYTCDAPVSATLTPGGVPLFPYLQPSAQLDFEYAYVYFGTTLSPASYGWFGISSVVPIIQGTMTTSTGTTTSTLATLVTYSDGRQNLAFTFDGNPYLMHSMLLSYGMFNWLTNGLFLGERHVYMDYQADDFFESDNVWDPNTLSDTNLPEVRMTGDDYNFLVAWQTAARTGNASNLMLELAFNGDGTVRFSQDTLTPAVKLNPNAFAFINHTYSHQNLDSVSYDTTISELTQNDQVAMSIPFANYAKNSMVQPDISGLGNVNFLNAAWDFGIRYLISDTSRYQQGNPSPNAGFYDSLKPGMLVIPRHPTNLFYNLVTDDEWVSEFNCYYSADPAQLSARQAACTMNYLDPATGQPTTQARLWSTDLTYEQILDNESDWLLGYLIKWDLDPVMFHVPNIQGFTGKDGKTHTLLGDLIDATLAKYNQYYNLPIRNLAQHDVGPLMASRMAYNASGVTASIGCPASGTGTLAISTVNPATIPVTGIAYGASTESYGGQEISYFTLGAGQSVQIPAPGWPASACQNTDLSISIDDGVTSVAPGATVSYTVTASNLGPSAVTGATIADSLPVELTNASWTCMASSGATCAAATGSGSLNTTADLPVGSSVTFTLTATVAANTTSTSLTNTATITPPNGTSDLVPANNSASDVDTIAVPDLKITIDDGVTSTSPGAALTYTIVASNLGPSAAVGAVIADTLPTNLTNASWTCTATTGSSCTVDSAGTLSAMANLLPSGSATLTLKATVATSPAGSTLTNTATITQPNGNADPNPADNTAIDTDAIVLPVDLAITDTDNVSSVIPGATVTYTIVASNNGPSAVTGATITDTLPTNLTSASWTCAPSAACNPTSGTGSINTAVSLPAGSSVTLTLTATVVASPSGSTLTNTATITAPAGFADTNPGNNSATDIDSISAVADLSITNTDNVTNVLPGSAVTYTIVASNAGPAAVTGAIIADTLPTVLTNATWTCAATAGSACAAASGSGSINTTANLQAGSSVTFTFRATVAANATSTSLTNIATITAPSGTTDPNITNNTAPDSDTILPLPNLSLLDNFNRKNSATLGTNWSQSNNALQVNKNQAYASAAGTAYWKASFGARQGAAFAFDSTPSGSPTSLILKATGGTAAAPANYIKVSYAGGLVTVSTITNNGAPTIQATFSPATFTQNNVLSAIALDDGSVTVYKTAGTTTTIVGTVVIPTSGTKAWTPPISGGAIGIQLPGRAYVDNFRGGNVP